MSNLKVTYLAYVDSLNNRRLNELGTYVHDQITFNDKPMTLDEYRNTIQAHLDAVPDFHWNVVHTTAEGESIAARIVDTGRPIADWLDTKPSGNSVTFNEFCFYRFEDAKIKQVWVMLDVEDIRHQLKS